MLQRVEKHIVRNDKNLDNLCFLSKNLYNYSNYVIRQVFTKNEKNIPEFKDLINEKNFVNKFDLITKFVEMDQADYRALPAQTSQNVIFLLYKNWKSFFQANKDYKLHPNKYKGKPRLPKYKDKVKGRNIVIFPSQNCKLKSGKIYLPKSTKIAPITTKVNNFAQVRIIPKATNFVVEVVYNKLEKEIKEYESIKNERKDRVIGIDLGVNNLCSISSNQKDIKPFLVNGRILKSINQYYNKKRAYYQSFLSNTENATSKNIKRITFNRNNKIDNSLHKISRYIVNFCVENKVGKIVIGHNKGWKQETDMSKKNNQNFVTIPFNKLIHMITYKAEEELIEVEIKEESYTSKCDSLALESIEHHEDYLGKRIFRGLFLSSTGKTINADINGANNIIRKVTGDDFLRDLISSGVGFTPSRVNIY